jgi:hypothetical protein
MQETNPLAFANTETAPTHAQDHPRHHRSVLFAHEPHQRQPRNVNRLQEAEQAASGFNTRVAVALTKGERLNTTRGWDCRKKAGKFTRKNTSLK